MITTRTVPALLPAHHQRVAQIPVTHQRADPLPSWDLVLFRSLKPRA